MSVIVRPFVSVQLWLPVNPLSGTKLLRVTKIKVLPRKPQKLHNLKRGAYFNNNCGKSY